MGAALLCCLPAQATTPPPTATRFPIGAYVGNPNGNDDGAEAAFEAQFASFASVMSGERPELMNAFVDFSRDPSTWPANAGWTAWSWTRSPVVGTSVTPIIGIPISDNAHWNGNGPGWNNDDFFKTTIAGGYDAAYRGVIDAWVNAGFKTLYLRLGYEMDGTFMPWFMGSTGSVQADWVAAFRHLSTLMRAEAASLGAVAYAVWNPADINWTAQSVAASYPGDSFVDVVSCDAYSPVYPADLYDWRLHDGTVDSSRQQWWAYAANRRHFWSYPGASQWNQHGTGTGWGMEATIAFAHAHAKPMAVSESGAGGDGSTNGPSDDPAFPHWMSDEMVRAEALGVPIAYVSIWDAHLGDGDWDFSSANAGKPLEAASWSTWLGAGSAARRAP